MSERRSTRTVPTSPSTEFIAAGSLRFVAEGRLLDRVAAWSAASQSALAGAYAWGVTVAPAAWSRGAPAVAKAAALAALFALSLGFASIRFGRRMRRTGFWAFVLSCTAVWVAVPSALGVLRVDVVRGIAGMLGWALFGLTSAAPARPIVTGPATRARPLSPRQVLARGDELYLGIGALGAIAIQTVGWRVPSVERALLVRFVVVASGLAVLATSAELALARHKRRAELVSLVQLRSARPHFVVLSVLAIAGVLSAARCW